MLFYLLTGKVEEIDADRMKNQYKVQKIEDGLSMLENAAIPLNVKVIHEKDILQWKEDDRVFHESHNFSSMLEKVKNQAHVTFVGVSGSGKTATARHIALMLQQEGYEIVPVKEIRKIEDYCDPKNPQVFVIDDVVGVFGLQNTELNHLMKYEDRIMKPIMPKSKTLMTCREAVYRESLESSSFFTDEKNIVLLHDDFNALTNIDKKCILKMYKIDVDLLSPACLTSASKMFPYLCKMFSSEKKFQSYGPAFFENPVPCILKELEEMKRQNKIHYVSLVLCMMNNNKLSEGIIYEAEKESAIPDFCEMKQIVLKKCKVSSHTNNFHFVDAMHEMEGTYTKLNGNEYSFVHDSMFEIVAHHFGSHFPELILKFMSSYYIANNVKVKEPLIQILDNKQMGENVVGSGEFKQGENNIAVSQEKNVGVKSYDLSIRLEEKYYPMLAKRLYRDIENMELYDVFMNNVLKEPKVYQAFEDVLKTKSDTELESLFLSEREVSNVKRWLLPWLEILPTFIMDMMEDRKEKLENKEREVYGLKYTLRVICWVIYYGHNKILQYILKRTEKKETGPVLFRNITETEIPEEYLLILLGCYSGDLETVKILLRYINNDTLNMVYSSSFRGACQGGHVRMDKELLKRAYGTFDITPLMAACGCGYKSVVKELIKAKANVNKNVGIHTPLSLACRKGHASIVQDLIKSGAKVNPPVPSEMHDYKTPLEAACESDQSSIVTDLLEAGADVNLRRFDTTPLIIACMHGNIRIVQQLLDKGADVNLKSEESQGYTPLLKACERGHMSIIEKLLDAGADVNIQDWEGRTPLHNILLYSTETQEPVKLMVNGYGADPTVHDTEGFSSICIALIRKKIEVINQLCNSESNAQSYSLKLHLFDCLRVISQRTVMLDSKDDVVVKEGGVMDVFNLGYKFEAILRSKSVVLKRLLKLGLDVNQWIEKYDCFSLVKKPDVNQWRKVYNLGYDMRPLLFTLIDEGLMSTDVEDLAEKVRILVEAGADVNVNYRMYQERLRRKNSIYKGMYISNPILVDTRSVVDKNGLSLLERTRRLINVHVPGCEKVLGVLKKHVRRYSV
ncbi:uncharacterized protein LOC134231547 [Saccostrea cucullata]|uniref:uncharacterized protein LOC134231547 n=1 Tax=Saccostrea cuccullata TaxID=36930 RepID=UPI002ED52D95